MNNRQILASLNKIANELDNNGLHKEASSVTNVMKRIAILTGGYLQYAKLAQDFQKEVNEILAAHSGFSSSMAIGALRTFYMNSPEDREQFLMNYKRRAEEVDNLKPDSFFKSDSSEVEAKSSNKMNKVAQWTSGGYMQAIMDRDIYKLILAATNFQEKHQIPDDIMKDIINLIK